MSTERVRNILHEHLSMEKLSARWVPRLLTVNQKLTRKTVSIKNLALYKRNPSEFLRRFITVDETWIHHYTPESKQQSKQCIGPGEPQPQPQRRQKQFYRRIRLWRLCFGMRKELSSLIIWRKVKPSMVNITQSYCNV